MSWSASLPGTPESGWDQAARELKTSPEGGDRFMRAQVETAKKVLQVMGSEFFAAHPHDFLAASVSGHAEPQHPQRDGWAGDMLSISISCICKSVADRNAAQAAADEKAAAKEAKKAKPDEKVEPAPVPI